MKRSLTSLLLFISLVVLHVSSAFGSTFDDALKAADHKKYDQAITLFEKVVQEQPGNVAAYYNIGNCYFEKNELGKAILYYEKVLKLAPKDAEAPVNIELCYKKLGNGTSWKPVTSSVERLIFGVGTNTWAILSLLLALSLAVTFFTWYKNKNKSWKSLYLLIMAGEFILLITAVTATVNSGNYIQNESYALVTKKQIPVFLNDEGIKGKEFLPEGTRVQLIHEEQHKLEVKTSDNRIFLVNKEDVEII